MRGLACGLAFSLALHSVEISSLAPCQNFLAPPSEVQYSAAALTESGKRFAAWVKALTSPDTEKLNWFRFTFHPQELISLTPSAEQLVRERKLIKTALFVENETRDEQQITLEQADMSPIEGNLYVISDVHLSGEKEGGLDPGKYKQFLEFLEAVARENGTLVVNGDFLELNLQKGNLFKHLRTVYAKLRAIRRVIFMRGNHDEELASLVGKRWKNITILDSMSIRFENEIVHIEHGHKSDYPWHQNGNGGGFIQLDAWLKQRGIPLQMWWSRFSSWMKFLLFPFQLTQMFVLHQRVKALRRALGMKTSPLWFPADLIWDLFFKKNEPTLNYVIGHYHEIDKWIFHSIFFSIVAWITKISRTRVKLHFTAGSWENHEPSPLRFTRITPDGTVERCKVADFVAEAEARRRLPVFTDDRAAASSL